MNHLTKGKLVVYLAAIFVAGGVTGVVIGRRETKERSWSSTSQKKICNYLRDRFQAELGLTQAQVQQLEPLLEKRAKSMAEIHSWTVQQLEELIRASNAEIATALELTPGQVEKLEQMEEKRRQYFGRDASGRRHNKEKNGQRRNESTNAPAPP